MEIELRQFITMIGVGQGFLFSTLLLTGKKYRNHSNLFLALALIVLSLISLRVSDLIDYELFIELFEYFALEYLLPAFLFLYVLKSLTEEISSITYGVLLLPFIVFSLIGTLISLADLYGYDTLGGILEETEGMEFYVMTLFLLIVSILSIYKIRNSNSTEAFKKWIYVNYSIFIVIVVLFLLSELAENLLGLDYWPIVWSGNSIFLMGISYFGVQQLSIEQEVKNIRCLQIEQKASSSKRKLKANNHFERLQQLMAEQELFKDTNLNREMIATSLGLGASTVTRILKENGGQSLNDFINQYRINLAKNMLDAPQFDVFSIEAIGKEVGYKSRSAFYGAFKKSTGLTPGSYKKR